MSSTIFYLKLYAGKSKIEASDVLVSNNTPLAWEAIKDVWKLHYTDKRDLMTLDSQLKPMTGLNSESIETYYSKVREMVTLICSAINTDEQWRGHNAAIIRLYNMMALDTFIRGVGEPLSLFLKNHKPKSFARAYNYCVEYQNQNSRNAPFRAKVHQPVPAPVMI